MQPRRDKGREGRRRRARPSSVSALPEAVSQDRTASSVVLLEPERPATELEPGPLTQALLDADSADQRRTSSCSNLMPLDLTGKRLENLVIEYPIGCGGMGEVWRARDTELDIPVAVKVLPPEHARDPQFVIRFLREARAVARLDHPNIVRVLSAGRKAYQGGYLRVMVMELIEGRNAHDLMSMADSDRLPLRQAVEIALGAARALHYAHSRGVVHRDVKPSNLLVPGHADGPAVKVLDFGLALLSAQTKSEDGQRFTQMNAIIGTPQYMSPEQAQALPTDARTDVYSLGITFYELLSGRIPFDADTAFSLVQCQIEEEIKFDRQAFAEVPRELIELVRGMCAKAPDDRLPLRQVIRQLEAFLGIGSGAVPTTSAEPPAPRTNLSKLATTFVGREQESEELTELIGQGANLITVVGPGGIGKTRFSQEYGLRAVPDYPGGVWFCDLTEARTPLGICHGISQALGVPLTHEDPIAHIHDALRTRERCLMILDNFEQVAEYAAETLGLWLRDTPQIVYVATSREPLHLRGERTFALNALPCGDDETAPAIRLFCDRAAEVRKGFALDANALNSVRSIVRELDCIPLAIELAASRVASMPPQKILERLPQRFDILTSRRRDASTRQMTLRGAIDWSWDLLQPYERLALAQCSIFRDGFNLEASEAVIDVSAFPEAPMVMDVIEGLAEKSLLRAYEHEKLPGEARYRMYESIRDYSARKIADPEAVPGCTGREHVKQLRLRHARHYTEYLKHWDERIPTVDGVEALNRINIEIENILEVLDGMETVDAVMCAEVTLGLATTLKVQGPWKQRIRRLERAMNLLDDGDPRMRCRLMAALIGAHRECGSRALSEQFAERAVRLAREIDPRGPLLAEALHEQAINLGWQGRVDEALECLAEAEPILRKRGSPQGIAGLIGTRGLLNQRLNRQQAASECYAQAEALHRSVGDLVGIARIVNNYGISLRVSGRYEEAMECFEEAEAISRQLGNSVGVALALENRGQFYYDRDEFARAISCYERAEAIQRDAGSRQKVAALIEHRGNAHLVAGNFEEADTCYQRAYALFIELGDAEGMCRLTSSRGMMHAATGNFRQAIECYERAKAEWQQSGYSHVMLHNELAKAQARVMLGNMEDALAALAPVETIARKEGLKPLLAYALEIKAAALQALHADSEKDLAQALAVIKEAQELLEQLGEGDSMHYVRSMCISAAILNGMSLAMQTTEAAGLSADARLLARVAIERAVDLKDNHLNEGPWMRRKIALAESVLGKDSKAGRVIQSNEVRPE